MTASSIDNEWMTFLESASSCGNFISGSGIREKKDFKTSASLDTGHSTSKTHAPYIAPLELKACPLVMDENELYISTKTKVIYLNIPIDIHDIFWKLPIVEYWKQEEGIVKKQIKIVSKSKEEYDIYKQKLENIYYYNEHIIKQIDNPHARRIKFKDERKITIGISKKDIMNYRGKKKNAFYNCFAIILRFKYQGIFKEIHIKVFNTGKMEIPGVQNSHFLEIAKMMILKYLKMYINSEIHFVNSNEENNVLINSNFKCGFYINQNKLYSILNGPKYNIETSYDPCTYPGVKCKFYYNNEIADEDVNQNGQILQEDRCMKMSELIENKKYTEISFMIFRTGSCLILGNCNEHILNYVYKFIKNILIVEYPEINAVIENVSDKIKKPKIRKRMIKMTREYYSSIFRENI